MSLDTSDKSYIATTISEALIKNNEVLLQRVKNETDHIVGAYQEAVRDDIRKVVELVKDRPTHSEVRESVRTIVQEEARPIIQEEIHRLVLPNFLEIHKNIDGAKNELRTVTKNHEKRISRLETAIAH